MDSQADRWWPRADRRTDAVARAAEDGHEAEDADDPEARSEHRAVRDSVDDAVRVGVAAVDPDVALGRSGRGRTDAAGAGSVQPSGSHAEHEPVHHDAADSVAVGDAAVRQRLSSSS
jgi:hypothetical protein